MDERIDLVLRIIAWGIISIVIFIIILKWLGVVHSPAEITLESLVTVGVLLELGRLETKISLLWSDLKKRRKM